MFERIPLRLGLVALSVLVAAVVLGACGSTQSPSVAPSVGQAVTLPAEVSAAEAAELRDGGAFVLDVREPNEWQAGHIPDATLIPLGQLPGRANEVPIDRTIVVVCRSGNRSAQGRDVLRQAGFTNVTSMAGGMNDWTAAGLPVVSGS